MVIVVGTSSWSDPRLHRVLVSEGAAGEGPAGASTRKRFDAVELNSTFYAIPVSSTAANWAKGTPTGFRFDVKLHRLSRHASQLKELLKDLRDDVETNERGRAARPWRFADEMVRRTAAAMKPLADAGKLRAYLLQLTPAFDPRHNELDELAPVIEGLAPVPVASSSGDWGRPSPKRLEGVLDWLSAHGPRSASRHPAGRSRLDLSADRRHQRSARLCAVTVATPRPSARAQRRRALRL